MDGALYTKNSEIRPTGDTHYNKKRAMTLRPGLRTNRGVETGSLVCRFFTLNSNIRMTGDNHYSKQNAMTLQPSVTT